MEQKEVCEKVVRILNMVLESCQDKLSRTLTNSLPDLSSRMLAKGLISHSVKESGGFDQIMQEFQSGWGFSDSVYDLEEQCFKFLDTLCDMRGAPAKAGKKLEKDWSKEVEKQLTDIIFLRRQKMYKKSHSTPVNVVAIRPNINRKSYSETHSHGTSMESHHNHHETDSTQPFTSDIDKRDQVFLDSVEETVSTDSFKTEDFYVHGEEEQDLQKSTINLSSPPNLLVPGQNKHQPSSLTFSQLQSEYSGHPVTTTPSHYNSIPVTDSSSTFQPPPAISHGSFQEERLEQDMELEVVTPKQATIQTESQSKSANSQPISSAHSSCSEYIQHLKDENQTLAAEKERFEKKKDKTEKAFVSMLKRENRELKKQVLKERRDQDEREKDVRRRETLLVRKEEQLEERQKQQDQREEKHDDKNQKRKMHWEKQEKELDQRYTNLGIQKKKLNLLRSQLDQKKDELKTKEQELKNEKDKLRRKKNRLTVLIILVVILLVVAILISFYIVNT